MIVCNIGCISKQPTINKHHTIKFGCHYLVNMLINVCTQLDKLHTYVSSLTLTQMPIIATGSFLILATAHVLIFATRYFKNNQTESMIMIDFLK